FQKQKAIGVESQSFLAQSQLVETPICFCLRRASHTTTVRPQFHVSFISCLPGSCVGRQRSCATGSAGDGLTAGRAGRLGQGCKLPRSERADDLCRQVVVCRSVLRQRPQWKSSKAKGTPISGCGLECKGPGRRSAHKSDGRAPNGSASRNGVLFF